MPSLYLLNSVVGQRALTYCIHLISFESGFISVAGWVARLPFLSRRLINQRYQTEHLGVLSESKRSTATNVTGTMVLK